MRHFVFIPVIASIMVIASCSNESASNKQHEGKVFGGDDVITTLSDGTRCAVWDGYKAGGISCDWEVSQ